MSSARKQTVSRQKRLRTEAPDDPFELSPSKRLKSGTKLHSAAFYNSLSKVWLTSRALKELDRRTNQRNLPQPPASVGRHIREDTWNQIKRFARRGGPELRDLRGYPAPTYVARTMSSSHSCGSSRTKSTALTSTSSKTKRSSAYDKDFEQHIIDHKIYPDGYNYPDGRRTPEPTLEGFHQRLTEPRPSLSPSQWPDSKFKDFKRKNAQVIDEGEIMRDVVPIIAGNSDIPSKQNLLFTRFASITHRTTVDAKPDFYDGAHLRDIDKKVRDDIGDFIIPTGHATAPVAPNFFLEVKRPSGGADVVKRQACLNGAVGARSMQQLQSYGQSEPLYDGNAYTISTTYHDGQLKMYTTHPTQSVDGTTEYHMSQVNTWGLTGNPDSFREGATAFRNARDWAQEQRDGFISAANERARSAITELPSFEVFDHNDGSDPTGEQDASHLTQTEDPGDDCQYYISQQAFLPESSTFESSDYHGLSDTTNAYPVDESETSPDELALVMQPESTNSKKRQHRSSQNKASKVPRKNNNKTRRGHRSKQ